MSLGAVATMPETASAASNGGVFIVAPKSWGWCPNIRGIQNRVVVVSVTNTTSGGSATDYGDDIIWVGVRMNARNAVHVNVGCSLGQGSAGTVAYITPTRNGQAFFVSPTGYSWGN